MIFFEGTEDEPDDPPRLTWRWAATNSSLFVAMVVVVAVAIVALVALLFLFRIYLGWILVLASAVARAF